MKLKNTIKKPSISDKKSKKIKFVCEKCNNIFYRYKSQKRSKKIFCPRKCYGIGEINSLKIGNIIMSGHKKYPYKEIYLGKKRGYILEHRWIIEKKLRRFLLDEEIVHHINEDTLDNRVENLRVYKNKDGHHKAHHPNILDEDFIFIEDNIKFIDEIFGFTKMPFVNEYTYNEKYN